MQTLPLNKGVTCKVQPDVAVPQTADNVCKCGAQRGPIDIASGHCKQSLCMNLQTSAQRVSTQCRPQSKRATTFSWPSLSPGGPTQPGRNWQPWLAPKAQAACNNMAAQQRGANTLCWHTRLPRLRSRPFLFQITGWWPGTGERPYLFQITGRWPGTEKKENLTRWAGQPVSCV